MNIKINAEVKNTEALALLLEHIANQLRQGFTSGHLETGSWETVQVKD